MVAIPRIRFSRIFLLCLFCTALYIFLLLLFTKEDSAFADKQQSQDDTTEVYGFLIHTPTCQIPDINPWDPSVVQYISEPEPVQCQNIPPLLYTQGNRLKVNKSAFGFYNIDSGENLSCSYREVVRVGEDPEAYGYKADEHYRTEEDVTFTSEADIEFEFIIATCKHNKRIKYRNAYGFFPEKSNTLEKKNTIEKIIAQRNLNHRPLSVLLMTLDSVSRVNLIRSMGKTAEFLDLKDAIPMYGYVKVGDNTFPNAMPGVLGRHPENLTCWKYKRQKLDDCPFIWKNFSDKGYITTYAEDSPSISTFNFLKTGFVEQPVDYYHRTLMLTVMNELPRRKIKDMQCHGDLLESEHVINYATDFLLSKKDRPYFAFYWTNYLTHNNLNRAFLADEPYFNFFQTLFKDPSTLNHTAVFFYSDHGIRTGRIRKTYIGWLEERMPFMYIWFPEWFRLKYSSAISNLRVNSRRLTSPFDLHKTLLDIADNRYQYPYTDKRPDAIDDNFIGRSWFDTVPSERTCAEAGIEPNWCTCQASLEVDPTSIKVERAVNITMRDLNDLLIGVRDVCAELKLDAIQSARVSTPQMTSMSLARGRALEDYVVVFQTMPGGAQFESTVRFSTETGSFDLLGSISRLNLYAGQSECVDDPILRKYCYCVTSM